MKKILFVEDDALVAKIYGQKLTQEGFDVTVAEDGLVAMKQLFELRPDLVVLDILMPRMSGLDVLRFIRQHPELKSTRVIVFSNAFLNDTADQLAALGVDEMVLKSAVTPRQIIDTINRIVKRSDAVAQAATAAAPETKGEPDHHEREGSAEFTERMRRDFFQQIPVVSESVLKVGEQFLTAQQPGDRLRTLESLNRKIGFVTHMTSMAGCLRIAQLSNVLEALFFELREKPVLIDESTRHTIASTIQLLVESLKLADQADEQCLSPTTLLVVDDDEVSNRALMMALGRFRLAPVFFLEPLAALEKLRYVSFDLVLLDINLPGMDGIQLCEQMRMLPLHQNTPVVFMTSHPEFLLRAQSVLRTGDDLIAKPILPIELTVKVIAHALRRRLARRQEFRSQPS